MQFHAETCWLYWNTEPEADGSLDTEHWNQRANVETEKVATETKEETENE
jgi:hypothetical protein